MGIVELFLIAVGLSMDAFAVAVCKGLAMKKCTWTKAGIVGLYFGVFQAGMPLIGYVLGVQFKDFITSIDHWIAFILLGIIGFNMVRESREEECETASEALDVKTMIGLAVATSIDALAVGVTFCISSGENRAGSQLYRSDYIYHLGGRCEDREYLRGKVQIKSRACRRDHSDSDGSQNIVGAFGILGIIRIPFRCVFLEYLLYF
mgnify:CR=1 FL=1